MGSGWVVNTECTLYTIYCRIVYLRHYWRQSLREYDQLLTWEVPRKFPCLLNLNLPIWSDQLLSSITSRPPCTVTSFKFHWESSWVCEPTDSQTKHRRLGPINMWKNGNRRKLAWRGRLGSVVKSWRKYAK